MISKNKPPEGLHFSIEALLSGQKVESCSSEVKGFDSWMAPFDVDVWLRMWPKSPPTPC